jgi:hypothetical protein
MPQPTTLSTKQRAHQPATQIPEVPNKAIAPNRKTNDKPAPNYCDRSPHWHRRQHHLLPRAPGCSGSCDSAVRAPKGIAAEVWRGGNIVLSVTPMHCLGFTPAQVVEMMKEILSACSTELEVELNKFASKIELHPSLCPIRPCPLCERNNSTSNINN